MSDLIGVVGVVLLVMIAVAFGPIFSIWAVNLLFGLTIPVTFYTWLSAFWLAAVVTIRTS